MKRTILGILVLAVGGCGGGGNGGSSSGGSTADSAPAYRLELVNLTHNQPLSPPLALLSPADYRAWNIGEGASVALERLAEGGDGTELLDSRPDDAAFGAAGPLGPGQRLSFEIDAGNGEDLWLTVAAMLVNTNDAYTGLTGVDLGGLDQGQSKVYLVPAYDAGTEFNSEAAGTIPGPVDGGEGFNGERDDATAVVTAHGGVVGWEDGNAGAVLSAAERFDNPVLRIRVTRL